MLRLYNADLLDEIAKYPILFDQSHEGHKNKILKDRTWMKVAAVFGAEGIMVKKRWKNLKDSYAKHLRSSTDSRMEKYAHWPWAGKMSLFKPYILGCLEQNEDTDPVPKKQSTESIDFNVESKRRYQQRRILKRKRIIRGPEVADLDDIDLLFLSYSKLVKKFSPKRQAAIKYKIAELMFEYEMRNSVVNIKTESSEDHDVLADDEGVGTDEHLDKNDDENIEFINMD